ncbi:MAG: endolytic transglycosylase MltG [Bacteroidetes bacterium]|uniref:endolytic transglycosylase MltG n=1 Tax=Phnomibacter sp. TaxID=2836217 RepID=UPI002FDEF802|nr:endolytic transglycosylase MltG [Bacteroidota bacterium]
MLKKIMKVLFALGLLLLLAAWWLFFKSITGFDKSFEYVYIPTGTNSQAQLLKALQQNGSISSTSGFHLLATATGYYNNIKPGKYRIEKGSNAFSIFRMLKAGRQTEVKLVIGKIRLAEEWAQKMGQLIETDSASIMRFLRSKDSLKTLGVDTSTWPTLLIQNTYNIYWTQDFGTVMKRLKKEQAKWWAQKERMQKAATLGYTAEQVYTIASIVEEETNMTEDKPLVASVYINRLRKGMPLQADPTVRFARKDFASNRVFYNHLKTPSPYNTYLNKGLPPGPICVPSVATLDAVLKAPATDYIYFVAKPDFSGYSVFNSSYTEHSKAAKLYQDSLTAYLARKAAKAAGK